MRSALILLSAFLFALLALLPMRLAIDWVGFDGRGLAARGATGSIWAGALHEARIGPVWLGNVSARLNLLPLLFGRTRISFARPGQAESLEGALASSRGGFGVEDVTGRIELRGFAIPVSALDLDGFSAAFRGEDCVRGNGRLAATMAVPGMVTSGAWRGSARCDGAALLVPLAEPSGAARLDLRFVSAGRYQAVLRLRAANAAAAAGLRPAGFQPFAAGRGWRFEGRL